LFYARFTPFQFTPLLNLCSHIFGLTPFDWLSHITPLFLMGSIIFYLRPLISAKEHKTRAGCAALPLPHHLSL
jgi:hypothetical protein